MHICNLDWFTETLHETAFGVLAKGLQTVGHVGCSHGYNSELYNNMMCKVSLNVSDKS